MTECTQEIGYLQSINSCKYLPQSPYTGQFFQVRTFCIDFYESYLSTVVKILGVTATKCLEKFVLFLQGQQQEIFGSGDSKVYPSKVLRFFYILHENTLFCHVTHKERTFEEEITTKCR
jgi:hypothetical protein